jgi:hypothetical protein
LHVILGVDTLVISIEDFRVIVLLGEGMRWIIIITGFELLHFYVLNTILIFITFIDCAKWIFSWVKIKCLSILQCKLLDLQLQTIYIFKNIWFSRQRSIKCFKKVKILLFMWTKYKKETLLTSLTLISIQLNLSL